MGSAQIQGELWSARAREWADLQESSFPPLFDAVFDAVRVGKGTAILDVGCGAGLALQMAQARGAKVTGLDAAAGFVEIARQRCPGGDIRVGESEELPFADASFDVITGFNSFQYATNPVHALTEAARVAKPEARVVIVVWGAAEKCQLAGYLAAIGRLLPPPPPGAPGPFALSMPGALEALVEKAGLKPNGRQSVLTTMRFPDEATAVRGLLASGVTERAIRNSGESAVRTGIADAIRPFREKDGSYRLQNEWQFLIATR